MYFSFAGVEKLLHVCSELKEFNYESSIPVTDNTRMTTAICLSKVYENMYDDKQKKVFNDVVDEYVR